MSEDVLTYNRCHLERFFVLKVIWVGNLLWLPDALQDITALKYWHRQVTNKIFLHCSERHTARHMGHIQVK